MYDKHHRNDEGPSDKGTRSPSVPLLVEDNVAHKERTKDLSCPKCEIVQSTRTNSEDGSVIIVEYCPIPN